MTEAEKIILQEVQTVRKRVDDLSVTIRGDKRRGGLLRRIDRLELRIWLMGIAVSSVPTVASKFLGGDHANAATERRVEHAQQSATASIVAQR